MIWSHYPDGKWSWSVEGRVGGENSRQIQLSQRQILKVVQFKFLSFFPAVEDDQDDQDAYFLMLPRVSYLPLVTDKVSIS